MPKRRRATDDLTAFIGFRCTATEAAQLAELARSTGHSRSLVLRRLITSGGASPNLEPKRPVVQRALWDQKALAALARIGNNINQIARELHRRDRQAVTQQEFANIDRALLQVIALTLSGPDAARRLFSVGLTNVLGQMAVAAPQGPREPPEPTTVAKG